MSTYAKAKYIKAYISCLAVDFNLNYLLKDNIVYYDNYRQAIKQSYF